VLNCVHCLMSWLKRCHSAKIQLGLPRATDLAGQGLCVAGAFVESQTVGGLNGSRVHSEKPLQ
jgi:hypothetical protein